MARIVPRRAPGGRTPDRKAPDRKAPDRKYLAVHAHLTDLIETGLAAGDAVPSERALTEQFGVARMTVRRALDSLVAEGVLVREQGRGTFVAAERADFEMRLTTFGEEARRRGMVPGTDVLDSTRVPAARLVAAALGVEPGAAMFYVKRLRTADGAPFSVEESWVPVDVVPHLLADGVPDSLYGALRAAGHAPTWGEDTIVAAEATAVELRLLAMRGSRAVMRTRRRTFAGEHAVMYSHTCYRGDRYSVFVPLREPRPTLVPRGRQPGLGDPAAADPAAALPHGTGRKPR